MNFLQDVPRDLELGRVYLPAEDRRRFGVEELDRPSAQLRRLLEFEAERARGLLAAGEELGRLLGGGRVGRAVELFARGGLAALEALERADWDIFNGRPRPSRARLRAGGDRTVSVEAAYAEVERLTRREARNFAYGIMVLPRDQAAGDRGDLRLRAPRRRHRRRRAARSRRSARGCRRCAPRSTRLREDAMLVALADARARYPIPDGALHDLVDGGLQDTEQDRYADFAELDGYCRRVAGAVGVACVAVYGSDDVERAATLGVALQLINILRDVREDWGLGRVYLPQDELTAFGVTEDDIAAGRTGRSGGR